MVIGTWSKRMFIYDNEMRHGNISICNQVTNSANNSIQSSGEAKLVVL